MYGSERGSLAFVAHEGVPNMRIEQLNQTFTGNVTCINQRDCAGMEIKLQ